jgi:hypothetical protein
MDETLLLLLLEKDRFVVVSSLDGAAIAVEKNDILLLLAMLLLLSSMLLLSLSMWGADNCNTVSKKTKMDPDSHLVGLLLLLLCVFLLFFPQIIHYNHTRWTRKEIALIQEIKKRERERERERENERDRKGYTSFRMIGGCPFVIILSWW